MVFMQIFVSIITNVYRLRIHCLYHILRYYVYCEVIVCLYFVHVVYIS